MITLCFTSVAAATLTRTNNHLNTTRRADAVVRTVRVGLIALVLVGFAGLAQAGGHGPSLSGMMSHASSNSGMSAPKFSSKLSSGLSQIKQQASDHKISDAIQSQKGSPLSDLKNVASKDSNTSPISSKLNKMVDAVKSDKISDHKVSDFADKLKDVKGNNSKIFSNAMMSKHMDKMGLVKMMKEKSHDCHDHCCLFRPCPWWYCWNYPTWCPMYNSPCGYYEDVPAAPVSEGLDLQLLAVRMIDSGDVDEQTGPAYRVWVRNNSRVAINHPFNVLLLAAHDEHPSQDLPQAGVRIGSIEAGDVLPIDIRLPVTANQPGLPMLHVLVDSHREIPEVDETNNGTIVARSEVLPVDMPSTPTVGPNGPTGPAVQPNGPTGPAVEPVAPLTPSDDYKTEVVKPKFEANPPAPTPEYQPTGLSDDDNDDHQVAPLMLRGVK